MYKGREEENDEGEGKGGDKAELVSCVRVTFLVVVYLRPEARLCLSHRFLHPSVEYQREIWGR